jgi:lysophospholipase L1-like esterase
MKKVAFLVWCLALLCLLEVGIRMVAPPQVDVPHLRVFAEGFYTWYPGSRFTYHNFPKVEPPTADIRINEHGLRGGSFTREKPAGETRVLVLGDSYTAGVQFPEDRIFTTLLANELDRIAPSSRHRVVNAGFNGVGTAQELLYFRDQGASFAPDVVVLQFAFNDVEDNLAHGGFRLTDAGLELKEDLRSPAFWRAPLLAIRDAISSRSLAFYLIYKAVSGAGAGTTVGAAHAAAPTTAGAAPTAAAVAPGVALVRALVAELIASANRIGAPVILLTIPSPLYLSGGDDTYDAVVAEFQSLVDGSENTLIVTDPMFRESENRGEPVYLAFDGHLGEQGHRLVATALAAAVTQTPRARVRVIPMVEE